MGWVGEDDWIEIGETVMEKRANDQRWRWMGWSRIRKNKEMEENDETKIATVKT